MSKKLIAMLLAAMMLLSLAAACGNEPAPAPAPTPTPAPADPTPAPTPADPTPAPEVDPDADKYGGTMTIGHANAPAGMDPHCSTTLGDQTWYVHVFEPLAVKDANGKCYGVLADYDVSEDGRVYTYTLRDRYFTNGDKVTMEDVEASVRRRLALGITSEAGYNTWAGKATFEFTDTQLIVSFDEPSIYFESVFNGIAYGIMPKEICEKYPYIGGTTGPNGIVWGAERNPITELSDVIGTGPYIMTEFTDNADIVLERNENYVVCYEDNEDAIGMGAPRKAYLDKIVLSLNVDSASRTAAMMAHEYDCANCDSSMKDQVLATGIQVADAGSSWTHGIFFNLDESNADSPIADVNVRKAIRAAIDVEEVLLAVCGGDASRVNLDPYPITKDTVYASTKMEDSGEWNVHDQELAKQYLAQSSYNGEPIVYLTHASGNFYNAAMAIVPQLEEIGLNIEMMIVENGSHSAMRRDPATGHDIGCWEVQKRTENPALHDTIVTGTQGWWKSDAKDAAIAIMKTTPTGSAKSIAAYEDYLDAVIDECPYILFGHPTGLTYVWPNVERGQAGQDRFYYWNAYFTD